MADFSVPDAETMPIPTTPLPAHTLTPGPSPIAMGEGSVAARRAAFREPVSSSALPSPVFDGRGVGGEGSPGRGDGDGKNGPSSVIDIHAYAERINYHGELTPTTDTLRRLHLAHLLTVPFENLDIHLGRPIVLDEEHLFDKIVRRRRGGFCFELNGLFAAFLREIGFAVTLLGGQYPREPGQYAPELDHLVLHVQSADATIPALVDVGSGRGAFAYPLPAGTRRVHEQPVVGASFRLTPEKSGQRLWSRTPNGVWERQYRFTGKPRALADFTKGCFYHQTAPESHFTQKRICTLMTPDGRITLSERRLLTTVNGTRTEQELVGETEYMETLRTRFGIDLDA